MERRGICRSGGRRGCPRASKEICQTKLARNSIQIPTTTTLLVLSLLAALARASPGADGESPRPMSPASELPPAPAHKDAHLERRHTNSMASWHHQPPPPLVESRGQKVKIGLPAPTASQMINELAGVTLTRRPAAAAAAAAADWRPSRLTRSSSVGRDNNSSGSEVDLDEETISFARGEQSAAPAAASRLSISNKVITEPSTGERELDATQWTTSSGGNNTNSELLPPAWLFKCRIGKDLYLDFDEYQYYTCANCYNQVPREFFKQKLDFVRLDERTVRLLEPEQPQTASGAATAAADVIVWTNDTIRIQRTFKSRERYEKWALCCQQAVDCCIANSQHLALGISSQRRKVTSGGGGGGYELVDNPGRSECPGTWDGLSCWPASPAGKVWQECPRIAYLLDFEPPCRGYVTKQCYPNASWFINRNGHEWSDYSTCSPEGLYKKRMLVAAVAYVCEALIVLPALLIIGKFPNRGGNKRIRIMKHLLFYILLNSLIQFLQRGFLASGYFAEYRAGPMGARHQQQQQQQAAPAQLESPSTIPIRPDKLALISSSLSSSSSPLLTAAVGSIGARHARSIESRAHSLGDPGDDEDELVARIFLTGGHRYQGDHRQLMKAPGGRDGALVPTEGAKRDGDEFIASRRARGTKLNGGQARLRRHADSPMAAEAARPAKRHRSIWKTFSCWSLQMAGRLVRLMSYAWMFTGGVYLCSALHCAPAEPPAKFIKVLFFLTHAFPTMIFLAYVTARTLDEPSPLNIIIQVPYYWLTGEPIRVDHLYASQQVCWFEESASQRIEDIADLPNMILVILNVLLFVFTLIILCRINRPGSTRADMSPCAYFRAAGTLLFLYGGHYFFLAYRPESKNCGMDTFIFFAFIAIDGVQGVAISIVFCYMTQEGKAVISKYWRNRNRFTPFRQCAWLSCSGDKNKLADNGYHHTPHNGSGHNNNNSHHYHHKGKSSSLNHSTRSNTSACNGHDNVTELVNLNDTQICGAEQF